MRNLFERALRWCSPKRYCKWMIARVEREWEGKLKAARSLTPVERANLRSERDQDIYEFQCWLTEIEDAELVAEAKKMDVHLEDVPVPEDQEEDRQMWQPSDRHYEFRTFGNLTLVPECRSALRKAMRERAPIYRKERREVTDLWLKGVGTIFAALTGLVGAAIGLLTLWKR